MFGVIFEALFMGALGIALMQIGPIAELVGWLFLYVSMAGFAAPTVALMYQIYRNGIHYKGWKFSIRKAGYLTMAVILLQVTTVSWWQTIIQIGLIATCLYHFIFTNDKSEEGIKDLEELIERL